MSTVNSTHEPRNGMIRALFKRCPLGWTVSSKTTPGDRWSCETTTRSAPLITKVPSGVRIGSSPRYTSFSMMFFGRWVPPSSVSLITSRSVALSDAE
jgi:hypothetical protein